MARPCSAVAEKPAEEKARLWYQLARAAEETGDLRARGGGVHRGALARCPRGRGAGAAARSGGADVPAGAWPEAAAAYEALLAGHGARLKRNEMLAALERLGIAYHAGGRAGARRSQPLEKALTLEPRRRVVLEALVEAAKAAGDDDAVVRHTQALLAVTEDRETKRELLEHVADDPPRAAQGSAAGDRGLHGGAGDLARRAVDHAPAARAADRDQAVEAVGRSC